MVKDVFTNMGTGVHLSSVLKVLCPTLNKRHHKYYDEFTLMDYSIPFKTPLDYRKFKLEILGC